MVLPPEQKTESAKNGLNSMSKPFFHNPSVCNKLHPPPFAREAKKVYLFYSARFSHFIDSLKSLDFIQALFASFSNSYFTEPPLFDDAYPIQVVPTLKFTSFPSVSLITRTPLSTLQVISITVPSVASLPLPPESL